MKLRILTISAVAAGALLTATAAQAQSDLFSTFFNAIQGNGANNTYWNGYNDGYNNGYWNHQAQWSNNQGYWDNSPNCCWNNNGWNNNGNRWNHNRGSYDQRHYNGQNPQLGTNQGSGGNGGGGGSVVGPAVNVR